VEVKRNEMEITCVILNLLYDRFCHFIHLCNANQLINSLAVNQDYTELVFWITENKKLEETWKKVTLVQFKIFSRDIFLGKPKNPTEKTQVKTAGSLGQN